MLSRSAAPAAGAVFAHVVVLPCAAYAYCSTAAPIGQPTARRVFVSGACRRVLALVACAPGSLADAS
ncbi:MAG: hypothetical protein HC828_19170 [Blastochloris sp.]|nr:hypothetical protein [Blastochloris sp.]